LTARSKGLDCKASPCCSTSPLLWWHLLAMATSPCYTGTSPLLWWHLPIIAPPPFYDSISLLHRHLPPSMVASPFCGTSSLLRQHLPSTPAPPTKPVQALGNTSSSHLRSTDNRLRQRHHLTFLTSILHTPKYNQPKFRTTKMPPQSAVIRPAEDIYKHLQNFFDSLSYGTAPH